MYFHPKHKCRLVVHFVVFCVGINGANALDNAENAHRHRRTAFSPKQQQHDPLQKHVVTSEEKAATNKSMHSLRPRLNLSRHTIIPFDPFQFRCSDKRSAECQNMTATFAGHVMAEFRRSMSVQLAPGTDQNIYNVDYAAVDLLRKSSDDVSPVCLVQAANVRVLRRKDGPFREHAIGKLFPKRKLFAKQVQPTDDPETSCVIVASAGSLTKSGLGRFIDNHDIVMRFNHAPVDGYAADVGRKTTIRVVNSQVVTKREFDFVGSPLFKNVSIAAWDPGKFNGTLEDWLSSPDFDLFTNYQQFRTKFPESDAHLVDPRSIWNLWRALQQFTPQRVRGNPPSSGFIGFALLLPVCSYVDLVEYIPSTRLNGHCHYYDEDVNPACTFGSWHPLAAEKLMAVAMNQADRFTVFQKGVVRIRRPADGVC